MKMTIFRKAGRQMAMLALCATTLYVAPMMAQDTAPPPPAESLVSTGEIGSLAPAQAATVTACAAASKSRAA